jgi:hypothetical protein
MPTKTKVVSPSAVRDTFRTSILLRQNQQHHPLLPTSTTTKEALNFFAAPFSHYPFALGRAFA